MPEAPEVQAFLHRINRWKLEYAKRNNGQCPEAYLRIFPRMFALGTNQRDYQSCYVDLLGYNTENTEPQGDGSFAPNIHDLSRSKDQAYDYLVTRPLLKGELHACARGKIIAIAAGHHLVTISLGLEANIIGMSATDFNEIIKDDQPGPNKNRTKAQKLRTFPLPQRFYDPGTSPNTKRTVNIFMAFISERANYVWVLVDFARIVRMNVISRERHWCSSDLLPGSSSWATIFNRFGDGPDWVLETDEATRALDLWRSKILSSDGSSPLLEIMCAKDTYVFAGFGRHLAHDFLHSQGLFPNTPASFVCLDNDIFDKFKSGVVEFMTTWRSPSFLRRCANHVNSSNPFAYNTTSFKNYYSSYLLVFRRSQVRVPVKLYNDLVRNGLLDPYHTIGQPYVPEASELEWRKKERWLPVFQRGDDIYTVIRAQCPEGWRDGPEKPATDLRLDGYKTTIGVAEFREAKNNKVNHLSSQKKGKESVVAKGQVGRRPTNATGLPGRPRKRPLVADIRRDARPMKRLRTSRSQSLISEELGFPEACEDTGRRTRSQSLPDVGNPDTAE
ncbi:hypothetical protein BJ138DRAFT_1113204 [Hygrophoropsis aurantiaca]|uniref:Uncharacterized protein n=1 Tax=Hygrophoropsis aurantiaca TaxID=72124 RepID=A0ACB8AE63_9AGAM|nr:hypothetical protein BJ138DRAFT_1113204 [Hygrophoropsis aurantiaca]